MTESRFQISDKPGGDAILVARGDDPAVVVQDFINLRDQYRDAVGTQQPAQVSAAQTMVQRPVNQPGGLGAVPVQSTGGDVQPCPNGGSNHTFEQGISKKTGNPWKAWKCSDKRCNMDGRGGNMAWIR